MSSHSIRSRANGTAYRLLLLSGLLLLPELAFAKQRPAARTLAPKTWIKVGSKADYRNPVALRGALGAFQAVYGGEATRATVEELKSSAVLALVLGQWTADDEERKRLASDAFAWSYAAHQKSPDDPMATFLRAKSQLRNVEIQGFYRSLPSLGKIEELALSVFIGEPDFFHGNALALLGKLYQQAPGFPVSIGDNDQARQMLRQALDDSPRQTEALLSLALFSLRDGKTEEAAAYLRAVQEVPAWRKPMSLEEKNMDAQWFLDQGRATLALKALAADGTAKSVANTLLDSVRGLSPQELKSLMPSPRNAKNPPAKKKPSKNKR